MITNWSQLYKIWKDPNVWKNIERKASKKKKLCYNLFHFCPALSCSHLANPRIKKKKNLHWQLLFFARKLISTHCILLNTLTLHFPNFIQSPITLTVFTVLESHLHKRPANCDLQVRSCPTPVFVLPVSYKGILHLYIVKKIKGEYFRDSGNFIKFNVSVHK